MPTERTVLVRFDRIYGNVKCYPANDTAEQIAKLAGTKTLTPFALMCAVNLGFQVDCAAASSMLLDQFLGDNQNRYLKEAIKAA